MEIAVGDIDGVAAAGISAGVLARIAALGAGAVRWWRLRRTRTRAEPRHAAALARLDPDRAGHLADGLRKAGILAPGRVLQFVHPLIRTSIYDAIPAAERGSAHAAAAELLAAEDADPGAVSTHLLHAPRYGDADRVDRLQAAARLWRGARPTRRSTACDGRWRNPYPGEATPGAARLGAAEATANDPAAEATLDRARRLATDPALKRVVTLNLGGVLIASRSIRPGNGRAHRGTRTGWR